MKKVKYLSVAALLATACASGAYAGPAVTDVNTTLIKSIRQSAATTPPPRAARAISMVGIAMFDAVNASSGQAYNSYNYRGVAVSGLSQDAVALSAGYTMMASLFPSLADALIAELNAKLGAMSITESQRANSLAFGQSVANNLFASRANDGSATAQQVPYVQSGNLGGFKPTQPSNPVLPGWGNVSTFGVSSSRQFDVGSPPAIGSAEWIADFNEVKALGCSTCGTDEQKAIATFWADGGGTFTPPGHWLAIANELMGDLSTMEAARLTALVGASLADAGITAWDTKSRYDVFRPITAIQNCVEATCGVDGDPNWQPLLSTPNFPSYTSGHSTFSGGGAGALSSFFGTDGIVFCTAADPKSGVQGERCFTSFGEAANEAGISRIYGGIHYEFDNARAIAAGLGIGNYIAANYFSLNGVNAYTGYDGIISGTRGLNIVAGREILSGVNTYTGTTTINKNAALALVGSGSIAGSTRLIANGVFDISATTSGANIRSISGTGNVLIGSHQLTLTNASETFQGVLSGSGSLNIGGGTLTLSGNSVFNGLTTVSSGRLNVTGSLASSAITVQNGAVLGGSGVVGSLTARRGAIVAPGMSIGTLSVNGDLALEGSSILAMEVSPSGADRINVTRSATLGGSVLAVNAAAGNYLFNTNYTLLSGNSVTGSFGITSGLDGFGVPFDPTVTNTGSAVILRLRPASLVTLGGPNAGQNQMAVAGAFDRAVNAGYNPQQFYNLYIQGPNMSNAQNQLSGEIHSAGRRVALEDTRVVRETAFNRLSRGTNNSNDTQTSVINSGEKETTIWLRGSGSWVTAESDGRGSAFKTEQQGVLAGVDVAVASNVTFGAMFTSTQTDVEFATQGSSRVKSTGGAWYAGLNKNAFTAAIGASLAKTKTAANRSITVPGLQQSLRSNSSGRTLQIFAEAAYDLAKSEHADVFPFARLAYAQTNAQDFSETGGIAAVKGLDQQHNITVANLGLRSKFDVGPAIIAGSASWRRVEGDRAIGSLLTITGVEQGANIFATTLDKNAAEVEAEARFGLGSKTSLSVGYNGTVGARNADHGASVTLSVGW